MKEEYPNYFQKMREIENNLSKEDLEVLENYLRFCKLSSGDDKIRQRKRYALQFIDIAEKPFREFDREVIEHIYNLIKRTDREDGGKNEVIRHLKFFINWLFDDANLLKGIKPVTQRKGYNTNKINSNTLVTKEEIEKLINGCKSDLKKVAMISLQVELGLRPCELLNLKWGDLKLDNDIGEIKIHSPKTRDTRVLPFKDSLVQIKRWKEAYHYPNLKSKDLIFPHPLIRNKKLYRTYLSQLYDRICKKEGIRPIYPYLLRHSKLTQINKTCPSKVASVYGGHSEKVAGMYTHLNEADIREVILKQIYDIKEPDIKQRKQLEKEVYGLKKDLKEVWEVIADLSKNKAKIKALN